MATTTVPSAQYVQKWAGDIYREYLRDSGFKPYMSKSGANVIVARRELVNGGQTINVPFTPQLTNQPVVGAGTLKGNEDAMQIYNEQVSVDLIRQAVAVHERDGKFTAFDLYDTAKAQVKDWFANYMRTRIINALLSVRNSTSAGANSFYGLITQESAGPSILAANRSGANVNIEGNSVTSASETILDGWLAANADRVLFGAARSNNSSNDHSASLANCDTTADTARVSILTMAKRMAKQANPRIRPLRVEGGDEYYVVFCGTRSFRDLQLDSTILAANRDARPRVVADNPIFTGGEMLYDGLIIKEIPEIPVLTNAGNGGTTDVQPMFLCGQQAIAYALGMDMTPISDEDDYGSISGLGAKEFSGVKKVFYNGKQHGLVTAYVAAAADS